MKELEITGGFILTIRIQDTAPIDIFERGASDDFPYWGAGPGPEYVRIPLTKEQVINHLAWNAIGNGVTDISELDGYADFPRNAVTFDVTLVEVHEHTETEKEPDDEHDH